MGSPAHQGTLAAGRELLAFLLCLLILPASWEASLEEDKSLVTGCIGLITRLLSLFLRYFPLYLTLLKLSGCHPVPTQP